MSLKCISGSAEKENPEILSNLLVLAVTTHQLMQTRRVASNGKLITNLSCGSQCTHLQTEQQTEGKKNKKKKKEKERKAMKRHEKKERKEEKKKKGRERNKNKECVQSEIYSLSIYYSTFLSLSLSFISYSSCTNSFHYLLPHVSFMISSPKTSAFVPLFLLYFHQIVHCAKCELP